MAIKLNSTNLTKNLARRTKLVQHLDSAMAKFDEDFEFDYKPKQGDDAFHPSGDCTPPLVDLYNTVLDRLEGVDTFGPIGGSLRKTFMVGHFWHALLQHLLVEKLEFATPDAIECKGSKAWGHSIDAPELIPVSKPGQGVNATMPQKWQPFHWARGSADVAPCTIPGHGDWLVDFKTMNSRDFALPGLPTTSYNGGATTGEKWECQLNIYMDWFDLDHALIIGIQKDSPHEFKEFEFHRNQPLIDAIYKKWHIISDCLDEGEPPHAMEDPGLPLQGVVEA